MKKAVLLIDGGYLRALSQNAKHRYTADFIARFANSCFDKKEEDPVRILYYDCAPPKELSRSKPISGDLYEFGSDRGWLDDLATKDLFAIRLGVLKWRGWVIKSPRNMSGKKLEDDDFKPRFEQKGVDMRMGLDIANFSYEKSIDRILLVSGDTDCIPAMKLARRAALQVVGIELENNLLGRELLTHIDIRRKVAFPETGAQDMI